ncbi:alanine aminotransferase 2-like [Ixodes scapularis]
MSEKIIEDIVRFSYRNNLIILADEVFEHNIYVERVPFHSFRKVMHKMGDPWFNTQLITFNSMSKGFMAEAGLCCGYFEIVNLNKKDKAKLLKAGAEVKASSLAQVALDCLVKPPKPGEPSYDLYREEKRMTLGALKEKAELVHDKLNSIEGFYCSPLQGAMAAFPRVSLPQRAIDKAKRLGQDASYFYVSQLLENAAVVMSEKIIEDIVRFSYRNNLIILADEVFEHNIYAERASFHSFRKVMHKMGNPWFNTQLITFNSMSKGFMAEAGLCCGYFEIVNLNQKDKAKLLKAGAEVKPSSLAQGHPGAVEAAEYQIEISVMFKCVPSENQNTYVTDLARDFELLGSSVFCA